jgi:MFS transporter, ACS family, tartrate transporter
MLLGLAVLALLTDRPERARWLSDEQRDWLTARLRRDGDESAAPHGLPTCRALAHPTIWLLAVPYFLLVTANYGYRFWAPTLIREALQASNMTTALVTGTFGCVTAAGLLAAGASSDRAGERCLHAAACAVLTAIGYVGAALAPTPLGRVAGIALVNSVGNVGGFVGPYVIGWLKDATGATTAAFLALAAFALGAASIFVALRRHPALAVPRRTVEAGGPLLPPGAALGSGQ